MKKHTVLVVDDEPDIRALLEITLNRMELSCVTAASVAEAIEYIDQHGFDLCLTDMNLGDGNGLSVIKYIQEKQPELPVAMITAYGSTETAIEAMKAGAFDYVAKPIDLNKLRSLIESALNMQQPLDSAEPTSPLLGSGKAIQTLKEQIPKLARSLAPVYIHGEAGSGKELVARLIHQQSARANKPFITINCGAIPASHIESELLGQVKEGENSKLGLLQAAEGGTLLLNEVADLPKDMQVKLLRIIQDKSFRPLAGKEDIVLNVRILSASDKNLLDEVNQGKFRQDLYYGINVIELNLPSLRDRPEDIAELSDYILEQIAERYETDKAKLSDKALKKLQLHTFPGNMRELENILERAFALSDSKQITETDLHLGDIPLAHKQRLMDGHALLSQAQGRYDEFIEEIEQQILQQALKQTDFNKTQAAELLGISFRTIRYKLKKFDMD